MSNANDKKQMPWESQDTRVEVQQVETRRPTALWVVVVVLAVALAGLATYDYLAMKKLNISFAQLPGIQTSLTALSGRMDAAEVKLSTAMTNWDTLTERMNKLDRKVSANVQLARRQTQEMVAQLHRSLEADLNERTRLLDARLGRLESAQEAQGTHLAQLQQQVGTLQKETGLQLDNLSQQVAQNQGQTTALEQRLDRERVERVDFEVAKKRTQELVPGVSLTLTKTNVSYQRFSGWLWLLPDHRTVWVRNQGVQRPIVVYRKPTGERYEVVVTDVTKDFAIGYLLRPAAGSRDAGERAEVNFGGSPGSLPSSR